MEAMTSAGRFKLYHPRQGRVAALFGALALLGGCAVGPDYRAPDAAALHVPARYATAAPAPASDLSRWWATFDDPLLTDMVARATAANLDIMISQARLRQARETLVQTRPSLLPSFSGSAGVNR